MIDVSSRQYPRKIFHNFVQKIVENLLSNKTKQNGDSLSKYGSISCFSFFTVVHVCICKILQFTIFTIDLLYNGNQN